MQYLPNQQYKYSFEADTENSQIKAPRPKPMDVHDLPPDFKLEEQETECDFSPKLSFQQTCRANMQRKRSLDTPYSILGFIDRKIRQRSRQRIMSEQFFKETL